MCECQNTSYQIRPFHLFLHLSYRDSDPLPCGLYLSVPFLRYIFVFWDNLYHSLNWLLPKCLNALQMPNLNKRVSASNLPDLSIIFHTIDICLCLKLSPLLIFMCALSFSSYLPDSHKSRSMTVC